MGIRVRSCPYVLFGLVLFGLQYVSCSTAETTDYRVNLQNYSYRGHYPGQTKKEQGDGGKCEHILSRKDFCVQRAPRWNFGGGPLQFLNATAKYINSP